MKKLLLLGFVGLAFTGCVIGQQKQIAARNGDIYEYLFSKKSFAAVFDAQVAPYLDPSSREKYSFVDLKIDDPEPLNNDSEAYLELKASSSRSTITIGVNLKKNIETEQVSRLYIPNLNYTGTGYETPDMLEAEGGWKCTSTKSDCGGCKKIREKGAVVGCPCLSGEGYCTFEITGGGGSNWPSWLTALILAILRLS
jgi:hypothetical protein